MTDMRINGSAEITRDKQGSAHRCARDDQEDDAHKQTIPSGKSDASA